MSNRYEIFQIDTRGYSRLINRHGWAESMRRYPIVEAQQETSHEGAKRYREEFATHYQHVATIFADELDDVFRVGNIGPNEEDPDETIDYVRPMHSISVGDVIVTQEGTAYMVDPYGFSIVNFKRPEQEAA